MLKKKSTPKIIYFQLEGMNEIFEAQEWELESKILATKHRLGLGVWNAHKILKNYAPINTVPTTTAPSSSISDPSIPTVVPKRTRKGKTKPQTNELSPVPVFLADTDPRDLIPEAIRNYHANRLPDALSDGDLK